MKGFIIKSIAGDFHVLSYEDNQVYICKARGQIRNLKLQPVCGDEVTFEYDKQNNFSIIDKIHERKNQLVRPPISNVDVALIVMSTIKPNFDAYLVDKLIVAASMQNIEPIIVVSKCELITDEIKSLINNYRLAGYTVIEVSSHQKINIDEVSKVIENKKVVLCGQSAVGKSSLINSLLNSNERSIGDFSEKLGRGKHQTREVEFININGAFIADSPGFSRLDLNVELTSLARIFKDFNNHANKCKFNTCIHLNEPDCEVKRAVENGSIDKRRYDNYLHLMKEIKDGKQVWRKK